MAFFLLKKSLRMLLGVLDILKLDVSGCQIFYAKLLENNNELAAFAKNIELKRIHAHRGGTNTFKRRGRASS